MNVYKVFRPYKRFLLFYVFPKNKAVAVLNLFSLFASKKSGFFQTINTRFVFYILKYGNRQ
jgi:hypothetical protein